MKKLYIIPLLLATILAGCEKHVELVPISQITSESFLKTEGDVQPAINGMYVRLRALTDLNLFIWGEARSEMMERAIAGTLSYDRYYEHTMTKDSPGPDWSSAYTTINAANLVLKYVPNIDFVLAANKNNALAQAYTMRAYLYFTLAKTWGSVPVRTEPTESFDPVGIQVGKTAEADVFKLIKADLDKALLLYPDNTLPTTRNRWSKAGANALKADVYLWTGKRFNGGAADFTIALNALNDVKATPGLSLLPSFADVFKYDKKGNGEIIMAIRNKVGESNNETFAFNMYASNTSYPSYVTPAQIAIVGTPLAGNGNVWRVSKAVRDQFTDDDTRKAATYIDMKGSLPTEYNTNYGLKMNGTVEAGTRYFASDYILYRYADILLMIAEAKNALGQSPAVEINLVRQRAYGSNYASHVFVDGTPASNDAAILKERLFELALEGKRWWDIVRFGKAFELVPTLGLGGKTALTHPYLLYWPIGIATITREPLVTETTGW